jgi:tight adherence protein B
VKRLPLLAAIVMAVAALVVSAGASASSGVSITEAKGPAFPVKSFVLSLPTGQSLTTADVHVTENGGPVTDTTFVPASKASKAAFGVVLVLDTSYSMKGGPIQAVVRAAKAFAAQRNPNEQFGIVLFNRDTKLALPLTTSAPDISAALATIPAVARGTHIYEAVAQAETMLTSAHITSGSIVLLSDGEEHGTDPNTLGQVARTALAAHIRIYTIGFDDRQYKAGTLKAVAAAGHGTYTLAKASALTPLFKQLSQTISSEYLLQYKSLAGPSKPVTVRVRINGVGTASTGYRTPALTVKSVVAKPYNPSLWSRILSSWITMIVLSLVIAAAIAFLVIALLQPRRSGLPERMAEFVSIRGLQKDGGQAADDDASEQNTWWTRLGETLEIADIHAGPEAVVVGTLVLTGLIFLLILAGTGSPWWALFALAVPYFSREWVLRTLKQRRNRFAEQLPDALQVVASALRSGHSFAGALAVVVESASEPMKSEMQRVVADEQLGVPIQNSLNIVAERMDSRDVEQLALVAQLQREAGGEAAEVVDRVAETVRERFDLKRLIQTLTTQGRMSRWIVSALPIVVVCAILLENGHYFHPLTSTTWGRVVIGFAAAWAVAGSLVIKRIVEIEV